MDASVGFAQSFDDLQSIQKLVGAFDPQQFLPAEAITSLSNREAAAQSSASRFLHTGAVSSSDRRNKQTDRVVGDVLEGLKHLGTCRKQHQ